MLTLYKRQLQLPPAELPEPSPQQTPPTAPPAPPAPSTTQQRFDLRAAEAQAEGHRRTYTLTRTVLGDYSLYWAEPWWAGLFSVVDIYTYLPNSRFFHPSTDNHESVYDGDSSFFNSTPWEYAGTPYGHAYDVYSGPTAPSPFSETELMPYLGRQSKTEVLVGEHIDNAHSPEVHRWATQRRRLPFWRRPLALPAPIQSAPDFNDKSNVTFVVMK